MPTMPSANCAVYPCPRKATTRGFCREHGQQLERARPNIDLRKNYRTARWRRLRNIVLREEPTCPECMDQGLIEPSHDVHHVIKATVDNFWDRANLQALCVKHHSEHTIRGE